MVSPAFAAGGALVPSGGYGAMVKQAEYLTVVGGLATVGANWIYDKVMRWGGGSGVSVSDNSAELNYKSNNNFSNVTHTGAKNNYIYNNSYSSTSKTTNNYQVLNTVNKTFYDITNNTYQTYNNITYNQQYNTYKIDYTYNNYNYNTYITNNNTYVSYYIVNESKPDDDTYAEVYLVLPDGRSSYGLKSSEVWGQYFNYNVSGADRVAEDDGVTLGLWHLDGNFTNSAYNQTIQPTFGSSDFRTVDDTWGSGLNVTDVDFPDYLPDTYSLEFRVFTNSSYQKVYVPDSVELWYEFKTSSYHDPYVDSACSTKKGKVTAPLYLQVPAGAWHTVSVQKENGETKYYLDGHSVSSTYDMPVVRYYWKDDSGTHFDTTYVSNGSYGEVRRYYASDRFRIGAYGVIDELRVSNRVLYASNYNPALAPFDTNLVQVRPSDPMDGDIVVYSDGVEITNHRVGGVRPTFPTTGFVWLSIKDDYTCDSVQVYNGSSWISATADIYYQGSWYAVKHFDFEKCCYIENTDPDNPSPSPSPSPGGDDSNSDISDSSLWNKLFGSLASAVSAIFKGLLTILATFASGFASVVSTLTDLFTGLVGLGGQFSNFTRMFFSWLPSEIVSLLGLSITLGIVMAVIRFFWK